MGEAVKELKRSIELDPSLPDAYLELAQLYRKACHDVESRNATSGVSALHAAEYPTAIDGLSTPESPTNRGRDCG